MSNIQPEEHALLAKLYTNADVIDTLTRRSPRLYDIGIEGHKAGDGGYKFSAWLPLAAIHDLPPLKYAKAVEMSDYPYMEGDWSGIRDSEPETIWRIFDALCLNEGYQRGTH
jgi:hypothetical protein